MLRYLKVEFTKFNTYHCIPTNNYNNIIIMAKPVLYVGELYGLQYYQVWYCRENREKEKRILFEIPVYRIKCILSYTISI